MKRYKKLTLLHSNDLHGDFFSEENGKKTIGGASRLSGYVGKVREKEENVIYDKKSHKFKEFKYEGSDIKEDQIFKLGLQKYHFSNLKEVLDISLDEVEKNGKTNVIATSCRDIVEEYLSNNQHLDTSVEENKRLIVL